MFSTLLSTIQTAFSSLVSKSFLISSLFPVCVLLAAMAATASGLGIDFVNNLSKKDASFQNTLTYTLIMIAVLALAYLISSLATVMLETLEGRYLPAGMRAWFHAGQYRRLNQLNAGIAESRDEAYNLKFDNDPQPRGFDPARLEQASGRQPKIPNCDYPAAAAPGNPRDLIDQLESNRNSKAILRRNDLEQAVVAILPYLERFNENENSDAGRSLKHDRERLICVALPWLEQLKWAAKQPPKATPCVYPPPAPPAQNPHCKINKLERLRARGEPIPRQDLRDAVFALLPCLRKYNENEGTPAADMLGLDRRRLFGLINYARDRRKSDFLRFSNQKQFNYPGEVRPSFGRSSINVLAPTRFGNIGRTMRSYALTRYSFDLDLFWTRLQRTMQNSPDKFYQVLQETKAQVDCFVALTFLSVVFTGFWTLYFMARLECPFLFLAIGVAGPVVTYASYRLACQSYSVFADLVRTAVDTFRFGLLTDLHVALPTGTREEENLWELLGDRTGYDSKETIPYTNTK